MKRPISYNRLVIAVIFTAALSTATAQGQQLHLGLFADPLVGWYSSGNDDITGGGVRAGFATGLAVNWYFSQNYAFSTGLTFLKTGGVQSSTDTVTYLFSNFTTEVLPGDKAIYSASYITMPIGMRLRTNQIGYLSLFTDVGLDPGFLNRGNITIPSAGVENELASKELRKFNLGFHIHAGTEYSLGGSTVLVLGLGYEQGFTDVTKDNTGQPEDKTVNKMIRVRLGIFF